MRSTAVGIGLLSKVVQEELIASLFVRIEKRRRFCSCQSTRNQQNSTKFHEQPATGSTAITWKQQNSTNFNRSWNLVRDQGVGGSNPLSPTNFL